MDGRVLIRCQILDGDVGVYKQIELDDVFWQV